MAMPEYATGWDRVFGGGAVPPEASAAAAKDITPEVQRWLAAQAQRRAMGLPPVAAVPPVAPAAPVAPVGAMGRVAAQVPTMIRGADGVMRVVRGAGAVASRVAGPAAGALVAGGEILGTADVAADPNATKIDVATRAAEGVGRLGAMGAGAGLGFAAGGPIGAALGGTVGYFAPNAIYAARDWWRNRGAPAASVVKPALPPAAPAPAPEPVSIPGFGAAPAAAVPATPLPIVPWTEADIRNGAPARIPEFGTGAVQVGRGAVRTLDTRGGEAAPVVAAPTGRTASGLPDVGGFFGATAKLRQIAQDNALNASKERVQIQYGGTAAHRTAQAANENLRTAAAQEHLKKNPGDYAGAAAVAAGRSTGGGYSVPFPPMTDKEPVVVLHKATGALERRQPVQYVTEANITASMNARKMTRAQAIEAYKKQGMDVSRITP